MKDMRLNFGGVAFALIGLYLLATAGIDIPKGFAIPLLAIPALLGNILWFAVTTQLWSSPQGEPLQRLKRGVRYPFVQGLGAIDDSIRRTHSHAVTAISIPAIAGAILLFCLLTTQAEGRRLQWIERFYAREQNVVVFGELGLGACTLIAFTLFVRGQRLKLRRDELVENASKDDSLCLDAAGIRVTFSQNQAFVPWFELACAGSYMPGEVTLFSRGHGQMELPHADFPLKRREGDESLYLVVTNIPGDHEDIVGLLNAGIRSAPMAAEKET